MRLEHEGNLHEVPFNSICALIITAHQIVYTHHLLQRLCDENIPLIILGKNYLPNGMLLSYVGHARQTQIQVLQISQKRPMYKKIWQSIVQEKIKNQSLALDYVGKENPLKEMHKLVLSADSDNKEGYAAKLYFKALFGKDFIRNRDAGGVNAFLNYGYAIIRAALARYVVAAGLNPAYGIAHKNMLNPFCLVDDLIEPFRPLVDVLVYEMILMDEEIKDLTPVHKAKLSSLLTREFKTRDGVSPLNMILQQTVWDLIHIYKTQVVDFHFNPYLFLRNKS